MDAPKHHIMLSAVLLREHTGWSAVCLERNIASQGKTEEQAKHALVCAVISQILMDLKANREPLQRLKPAPDRYWKMFHTARPDEIIPAQPSPSDFNTEGLDIPHAYIVSATAEGHQAGA